MSEKYFAESIKNRKNRFSIEILYLFFHNISLLGYRGKIWYRPQGSKTTRFPKKFQLVYQYRDDLCYLHERKSLFGEKQISKNFPSKKIAKNRKKIAKIDVFIGVLEVIFDENGPQFTHNAI